MDTPQLPPKIVRTPDQWLAYYQAQKEALLTQQAVAILDADARIAGAQAAVDAQNASTQSSTPSA